MWQTGLKNWFDVYGQAIQDKADGQTVRIEEYRKER